MDTETRPIPYFEYQAINQIIHAHADKSQFGDGLRAVIAFGDLVTRGDTFDIALLEVADTLGEAYSREYESTASLALRGKMFLYFLPITEFEQAALPSAPEHNRALLERVLAGYEIVYETPVGYARDCLRQARQDLNALPAQPGLDPFQPFALSHKS